MENISVISKENMSTVLRSGLELMKDYDPELASALLDEQDRQKEQLVLVASSSVVNPNVLFSQCTAAINTTAEGYPGARYHAGCINVDKIESIAIERAKSVFNATFANVQAHAASTANLSLISAILQPGDTLLGMDLSSGGHLTHGAPASFSGKGYNSISYHTNADGIIDYEEVFSLARKHKPKLIICGTTAYARQVDFEKFNEIAIEVGAYLLADISHIAGLIIAGKHPSPIDLAHFTTTCTHKQMYGPRGALILGGKLTESAKSPNGDMSLERFIQRAIFPHFQGAPVMNRISALAHSLKFNSTVEFKNLATNIQKNAKILADGLKKKGYKVVSDGTDTHIVLIDLINKKMSGYVAEKALEKCNIIVNKNRVPGDTTAAFVSRGIRLGTNTISYRQFTEDNIEKIIDIFDKVINEIIPVSEKEYSISESFVQSIKKEVRELTAQHPIPGY
ncbi:serine hydroxymethyltransferase [Niallia taxi]|uniref:serine hydroxymethyltransferase n=1 Tax=Niallia taxi TaxID=2499688 RepID=UPI003171F85A